MSDLHRQMAADFAAELHPPACLRLAKSLTRSAGLPPGKLYGDVPEPVHDEFTAAACGVWEVLSKWKLVSPDDPAVGLSLDERSVLAVFDPDAAMDSAMAGAKAAAARIVSAQRPRPKKRKAPDHNRDVGGEG